MKDRLLFIALVFTSIFIWLLDLCFVIVLIFGTEKYTTLKIIDGYLINPIIDLSMFLILFFLLIQYKKK
jgi:hypothetical protein